jgi:hypothetical protein
VKRPDRGRAERRCRRPIPPLPFAPGACGARDDDYCLVITSVGSMRVGRSVLLDFPPVATSPKYRRAGATLVSMYAMSNSVPA